MSPNLGLFFTKKVITIWWCIVILICKRNWNFQILQLVEWLRLFLGLSILVFTKNYLPGSILYFVLLLLPSTTGSDSLQLNLKSFIYFLCKCFSDFPTAIQQFKETNWLKFWHYQNGNWVQWGCYIQLRTSLGFSWLNGHKSWSCCVGNPKSFNKCLAGYNKSKKI